MRKHSSFLYLTCLVGLAACAHPRALVLSPTAPEGVRVYGVGEATGAPDIARTKLGVDVRAATPEQAITEASQRMAAVTAALKQLGIADADLQTSRYGVTFEPTPPTSPQPAAAAQAQAAGAVSEQPKGYYRVVNSLEVTIRNLELVGRVIQVSADADANNVWGISFDVEDDTALVDQARADAIADARRSAQDLARLAGVELGEVVSITEEAPDSGYGEAATYAMQSVPVEQGTITIRYGVQLVYATRRK